MADLIDRQAAISLITAHNGVVDKSVAKRLLIQMPSAQPEITDERAIAQLQSTGWMQEHDRILTESASSCRSQQNGWIPCSYAQPTKKGQYQVTVKGTLTDYVTELYFGIPLMPMNGEEGRSGWYDSTPDGEYFYDDDVIAWRELPEPWGRRTAMTKQEAIEQFQYAEECIDQYGYDWLDERDIPMLDMAIFALQEQIQREDDGR